MTYVSGEINNERKFCAVSTWPRRGTKQGDDLSVGVNV